MQLSLTNTYPIDPALLSAQAAVALAGWHTGLPVQAALVMASIAAFGWISRYRRYRLFADTPGSHIASAAQGYVELVGTAQNHPGDAIRSPLSATPCVWYRFRVEERPRTGKGQSNWSTVDEGSSNDTFLLVDPSGRCIVDADAAEIHTTHVDCRVHNEQRLTEWLLLAGDTLNVMGEFTTLGGANSDLDARQDISELLTQWKRDQADLRQRFDQDKDGNIDEAEWSAAREAARRDIENRHREVRLSASTHLMRKPGDHRPFIIGNQPRETLKQNFRIWSYVHLGCLLAIMAAISMAVSRA